MRNEMDAQQFGKPAQGTIRNAKALIADKPYKIDYVYQELSKFGDFQTKQKPLKAIAVYKDMGLTFYTYLCKDYDNKSAEWSKDTNDDIKAGNDVFLIYYGSVGNYNVTRLLCNGEKPDPDTIKGMKAISKAQATTFVMNRRQGDDDEDEEDIAGPLNKMVK